MISSRFILQYFCLFCLFTSAYCSNCLSFKSNNGATFDLNELSRKHGEPNYIVEDGDIPCTPQVEQNYTYLFNICGTVTDVPDACAHVPSISASAALQVDKTHTTDWCFNLGLYTETTAVTLINANDPTEGIRVTYSGRNDDFCRGHVQRKFHIDLQCQDRLNPVPTHALELSHCEYTVTLPSVYGCPLECPVANRRLCGGNGHCAYDNDDNSAKCFCNKGWTGADCNEVPEQSSSSVNYSPALLGLIITLFVLICILVAAMALMVRQLSAYKEDLMNYQALKGGEEDSAAV